MLSRTIALTLLLAGASIAADSDRKPLSVEASATEVRLHWFERKPVIVERKVPNGEYQQLGIAQDGEFTDTSIDRNQIYIYRATPVSDTTAAVAVTVGPPPAGYSQVAVNPKQNNPNISAYFGQYVCMVLDQNGDPMLAYVWVNPSGAKLTPPNSDTAIYFVSWNRSTNSYNAPVQVVVTGDIESGSDYFDFNYPLALARDPVNNTLGIAYRSYSANGNTAYVNIAFSTNNGVTWTSQQPPCTTGSACQLVSQAVSTNDYRCIDLALYNGAVYEMYYVGTGGPLQLATGTETTAPSTWSIQHSYQVSGYPDVVQYYSLALDSTGTPAVVITRTNGTGTGAVPTYFWRPTANPQTIAEVMTDNGFGQGGDGDEDNYAVRLTFYGTQPIIVYNGARNASESNAQQVWLAYSTTGATWNVTNVPANDGQDGIEAPFGIAVGSLGQVMVAASYNTSGGGGCGEKTSIDLAYTTNFTTWTVCGMGGATSPSITSLYPTVRYGVNDALFVSFVEPNDGDPLPNGVYVWSQYTNPACSYSVTSDSQTVPNTAGGYSLVLNAGTNCSWVDASNASWLTITSAASGSGTATINFSAAANTTGAPRVGTLTVAGIAYTVTQSATTAINFQTVPSGLQFSVDGTTYMAPQTLTLTQAPHTIAVNSPQTGATGTQNVFASWNDAGTQSHSITVGTATATYTATFQTQYQLTISASPAGGGTVTPSTGGFYNAGASVTISAAPNSGYQFVNWTGSVAAPGSASTTVTMNAAETVTANFSSSCTIVLTPAAKTEPPTGTSTVETCPNNSGQPSCGVYPETPQSFTVTPTASCGPWTATSSVPEFLQVLSGAGGTGPGTVTFAQLTNTHNGQQSNTITVAAATGSATYTVTLAGNADNETYRQIYALYEQLLGRDPDSGGFAFWSGIGGASLGQMADDFLTSPEAFNTDFAVMAAYQAATGAAPTYTQYTVAAASIRAGAQTVPGLFNSLIGAGFTSTALYQNLLNRAPGTADGSCVASGLTQCFQTIVGYPANTTPVSAPNNEFQSTGIYQTTLAADHTNSLYMTMVYFVTVNRNPDPSGFAFWLGIANMGGPGLLFQGSAGYFYRDQILGPGTPNQGFIGSPEFQGLFAN
jgi:hypothetical protein